LNLICDRKKMIIQITIQKIVIFIMYITIKPGLNCISVFNF